MRLEQKQLVTKELLMSDQDGAALEVGFWNISSPDMSTGQSIIVVRDPKSCDDDEYKFGDIPNALYTVAFTPSVKILGYPESLDDVAALINKTLHGGGSGVSL